MSMDRLTARTKNGHAYLVNVKPDEQEVNSPHKNTIQCILDCFERLAQYEDLEEQRRLAMLPCDAGDPIYPIDIDRDLNKPPFGVTGFRFLGFDNEGWIEAGLLKYRFTDIGKTVFLTRTEAEAAAERKRDG